MTGHVNQLSRRLPRYSSLESGDALQADWSSLPVVAGVVMPNETPMTQRGVTHDASVHPYQQLPQPPL